MEEKAKGRKKVREMWISQNLPWLSGFIPWKLLQISLFISIYSKLKWNKLDVRTKFHLGYLDDTKIYVAFHVSLGKTSVNITDRNASELLNAGVVVNLRCIHPKHCR